MSSQKRRIERDVMKLLMSDMDVSLVNNNMQEFIVKFHGPKDSPFQGGTWKVRVELPDQYPYNSPSIGFQNKIFHPNIEESSGSVCLDVINQTWSPMFDVFNIFDVFLPQLLIYPNAADPMNTNAGALYKKDKALYEEKVKEYVQKYASNTAFDLDDENKSDEEDAELSDVSSLSDDPDEDQDDEDEDEDDDLVLDDDEEEEDDGDVDIEDED